MKRCTMMFKMINDSDLETEDKYAALGYVTDKIAELVEKILASE